MPALDFDDEVRRFQSFDDGAEGRRALDAGREERRRYATTPHARSSSLRLAGAAASSAREQSTIPSVRAQLGVHIST